MKILEEFICILKNAKGDVKGVKRIFSGNLHKTGGQRNPNKMWNCIFCESTRIWGRTTLVFGTVEIRISLRIRQKVNAEKTYTGLEERGTLIRCGTVFFVNPQEFGVRLLWFLGTVEIGNFT